MLLKYRDALEEVKETLCLVEETLFLKRLPSPSFILFICLQKPILFLKAVVDSFPLGSSKTTTKSSGWRGNLIFMKFAGAPGNKMEDKLPK